jgi:hypothetical protein
LAFASPETIVKVRHLEKELDTVALWATQENNERLLTTRLMTVLQEIQAKMGKHSYMDQHFITNLFRAFASSPTKKFLSFLNQLKRLVNHVRDFRSHPDHPQVGQNASQHGG